MQAMEIQEHARKLREANWLWLTPRKRPAI